jgi:hypothetical protein
VFGGTARGEMQTPAAEVRGAVGPTRLNHVNAGSARRPDERLVEHASHINTGV